MKLIWRARARADLNAAIAYVAKESPAGALSIRERILRSVALLERWPEAGKPGRRVDLREHAVPNTPYLIIYRHEDQKVFVLRVWHTSRKR